MANTAASPPSFGSRSNQTRRFRKTTDRNAPSGTRTPDPLIKNQLTESTSDTLSSTYGGDSAVPSSSDDNAALDADLRRFIAAWPSLPETVRVGIVAMVLASGKEVR